MPLPLGYMGRMKLAETGRLALHYFRNSAFSKRDRLACPVPTPIKLAEGGGIEPLGRNTYPGFQDQLPAT